MVHHLSDGAQVFDSSISHPQAHFLLLRPTAAANQLHPLRENRHVLWVDLLEDLLKGDGHVRLELEDTAELVENELCRIFQVEPNLGIIFEKVFEQVHPRTEEPTT